MERIFAVILLLLLMSCGDKPSPLEPSFEEVLAEKLVYFPLAEDYAADYSFEFSSSSGDAGLGYRHTLTGTLCLEVVNALIQDSLAGYKLEASFFVEKKFSKEWSSGSVMEDSVINFVKTVEYDIMYVRDTLWYVENAPSFEQLDEGDKSLMMTAPFATGGEMDFRLFDYPDWSFNVSDLSIAIDGDGYGPYTIYINPYVYADPRVKIIFTKKIGITEATYLLFKGLSTPVARVIEFTLLSSDE